MPRRLSSPEFVALLAFLFAAIAFSVDSMLPALPQIAAELTPDNVNNAQLVLTSFVFGMGLGTMLVGPLSDTFGRKPTIVAGLVVYAIAAYFAGRAGSLEGVIVARVMQGIGAAAPRIVGLAMVRDLHSGRKMAQITSFVMMIFILVPAVAPALGALIIADFGWRGVFFSYIIFAIFIGSWLSIRQEETLPKEKRHKLSATRIWNGVKETLSNPSVRIYVIVLTLGFGQMFALLSSIQQIYSDTFDRAASFPMWFAIGALIAGSGTMLNARFVMTLGMRKIAIMAYTGQTIISAAILALTLSHLVPSSMAFWVFYFWSISIFFMAGVTFGNLTALALESLGHIAGLASSVVGAISTVMATVVAAPIGLAFNGTIVPLVTGSLVCSGLALILMRRTVDSDALLAE